MQNLFGIYIKSVNLILLANKELTLVKYFSIFKLAKNTRPALHGGFLIRN
jgi:hypothetical protein